MSKPYVNFNDGRAPDTSDTLLSEPSKPPKETVIPLMGSLTARELQSYRWEDNSCFFDVGLEIWYRAYLLWPREVRTSLTSTPPDNSVFASILAHYQTRIRWSSAGTSRPSKAAVEKEFGPIQKLVRDAIADKWKLSNVGDYGCAISWMNRTIQVSFTSRQSMMC